MSERSIVIGTAGHIDHGKSALVRALTGTDPDRLKEEQERGITIDLGFATSERRRQPRLRRRPRPRALRQEHARRRRRHRPRDAGRRRRRVGDAADPRALSHLPPAAAFRRGLVVLTKTDVERSRDAGARAARGPLSSSPDRFSPVRPSSRCRRAPATGWTCSRRRSWGWRRRCRRGARLDPCGFRSIACSR